MKREKSLLFIIIELIEFVLLTLSSLFFYLFTKQELFFLCMYSSAWGILLVIPLLKDNNIYKYNIKGNTHKEKESDL